MRSAATSLKGSSRAPSSRRVPAEIAAFRRNAATTSRLIKLFQGDEIVFFVGAGLSADLGYPLWENFLKNVADGGRAGLWAQVGQSAETDLSVTAQQIEDALRAPRFNEAVRDQFDERRMPRGRIRGAVALLPKLVRGPIITTNLDHVLEKVFEQERRPFKKIVWGNDAVQVTGSAFWFITSPMLMKFHGDYADGWIITKTQYDEYYGSLEELDQAEIDDTASALRPAAQLFAMLARRRQLFFVGCSLRQDRTLEILRRVADPSRPAHYALLEAPENEEELDEREQALARYNIVPIWYLHGSHSSVTGFLEHLAWVKDR